MTPAAKLLKGVLVVKQKGKEPQHPFVRTAVLLVVCVMAVGIGHRIVTGEKEPTPLHGAFEAVQGLTLLP